MAEGRRDYVFVPPNPPSTPIVDHRRTDGSREIPPSGAGDGREGDRRVRREDKFVASHSISDGSANILCDEVFLQMEIDRLEREMRVLSAQKPRKSRSEIRKHLPSSSVNADKVAKKTTSSVTPRPPRTSDSSREMDFNDDDCVPFNLRYNPAMTVDSDGSNGQSSGPAGQPHGSFGSSLAAPLAPSGQAGAAGRLSGPDGNITSQGHRPNPAASAGNSATSGIEANGPNMVRPTSAGDSLATGNSIPVTAGSDTTSSRNGQFGMTTAQVEPSVRDKSRRRPLKLERYDGSSTPLETFLAKFNNCARYNEWSEVERTAHLCDSLDGCASQILWEISDDATDVDIIRLLRNRFGNSNLMERYRAELHSRRRKRGESLQLLCAEIRKLLALAFPGQSGELYEIIGRDVFLTALDDPALRIRILDQQP